MKNITDATFRSWGYNTSTGEISPRMYAKQYSELLTLENGGVVIFITPIDDPKSIQWAVWSEGAEGSFLIGYFTNHDAAVGVAMDELELANSSWYD